jgi:hypothetical protein
MGWVRFLLAAAALPAIFAGLWLVLSWPDADPSSADIPVLVSETPGACERLQAASVAFALTAERDMADAPADAYAAASDAFIASELAAAVCQPEDWAAPKLRTRPEALRDAAYERLSAGSISDFASACDALEDGLLSQPATRDMVLAHGQGEYAAWLADSARAYVCTDRPRHRIGPASPEFSGG